MRTIIGYCPQFDGLLDNLTGSETLEIFDLLCGVSYSNVYTFHLNLTKRLANELNFQKHINKKVREYLSGNKKKLSTALALADRKSSCGVFG